MTELVIGLQSQVKENHHSFRKKVLTFTTTLVVSLQKEQAFVIPLDQIPFIFNVTSKLHLFLL